MYYDRIGDGSCGGTLDELRRSSCHKLSMDSSWSEKLLSDADDD